MLLCLWIFLPLGDNPCVSVTSWTSPWTLLGTIGTNALIIYSLTSSSDSSFSSIDLLFWSISSLEWRTSSALHHGNFSDPCFQFSLLQLMHTWGSLLFHIMLSCCIIWYFSFPEKLVGDPPSLPEFSPIMIPPSKFIENVVSGTLRCGEQSPMVDSPRNPSEVGQNWRRDWGDSLAILRDFAFWYLAIGEV